MTAAIQQAIFENNEGTKLVRQCHYDAAVKSFTSVLQILKPTAVIVEDKHKHNAKKNAYKSIETDDIDTDTDTDTDTFYDGGYYC